MAPAAVVQARPCSFAGHSYRADIDGLRAIAVIPVVLFHAGISAFSGGFAGVDVFFVISGFLITSILAREVANKSFSLINFYERRVRRITPALFVMMGLCIVPAAFLLPPDELTMFAKSLLSAVLFCSNFFFWSQTGYFDAPAETHVLLHTWSLAIEEQFYLIFPLGFTMLLRHTRTYAGWILSGIAVISLAGAASLGSWNPDGAFYFSPTRAWELLIGSVVALRVLPALNVRRARDAAGAIGLVVIVASVLTLDGPRAAPLFGVPGLWPCIGAALVLHAGVAGHSVAGALLASRLLVATGKISYSLYLWHWPIFVFAKALAMRPLGSDEVVGLLCLSVCTAVLSYRFIEQPYRRANGVFRRHGLFISAGLTMVGFVAIGSITIAKDGFPNRFRGMLNFAAANDRERSCLLVNGQALSEWGGEACLLNAISGPPVLLWGDSFGGHYMPGFLARAGNLPFNVLQYNLAACTPGLASMPLSSRQCSEFNDNINSIVSRFKIDSIILASNWDRHRVNAGEQDLMLQTLAETIAGLKARGIRVAVMAQTPTFKTRIARIYWARVRDGKLVRPDADAETGWDTNAKLRAMLIVAGATFIEPSAALCSTEVDGQCTIGEGMTPYYWDQRHFTTAGSIWAMAPLWPAIEAFAAEQ